MNKATSLKKLKELIELDKTLPLRKDATNLVFGEGNPNAKILFLGEAPGRMEDLTGKPFSGAAGKLLDKLLQSINLPRDETYISNIVKFRPPQNRTPTPQEVKTFLPYINQQIDIICPKLIITLGAVPLSIFYPDIKISQIQGRLQEINYCGKTIHLLPLYHPAAALRNGHMKEQLETSFKKIPSILSQIK